MHTWIVALASIALAAGPRLAWAQAHEHGSSQREDSEQLYSCPMHPEIRVGTPGQCPICGMTLVPVQDEHGGHEHGEPPAGEHGSMPGMEHPAPEHLSLGHAREGSGTSWLPDSSPVFAHHFMAANWMLMLHYNVAAGYDDQWSERGSRRFTSLDWVMGMASHPLLGGALTLRTMLSLEPATAAGPRQLPLLLQSGETYGGQPLHDRQHPHDLFMEVAALYRRPLGGALGVEVYGALSGEPALGPTAFMHRPSALSNPFPPIGHHWQDSTHISFGVLTAAVYNGQVKLEGSVFHGREPDENRWDFDLGALDSWSGRLSVNPTGQTSFQVSYGYLTSPEALRPDENLHRVTASGTWSAPQLPAGNVAVTALWGRNVEGGHPSDSALVEANLDLDGANVPFARLEYVQKLGQDLVLAGDPTAKYDVFQGSFGYVRRLSSGPIVPVVGISVDVALVPASIEGVYGTRFPAGAFLFVGLQPPRLSMSRDHHTM